MPLTDQEKKVLKMTAELWNEFLAMPAAHCTKEDIADMRFHINAIQSMVYARPTVREEMVSIEE